MAYKRVVWEIGLDTDDFQEEAWKVFSEACKVFEEANPELTITTLKGTEDD